MYHHARAQCQGRGRRAHRRQRRRIAADHAANGRPRYPPVGMDVMKTVSAVVAHEVALRLRILARPQPINDLLILIDENTAAGAAVGADTLLRAQKPDPLLVEKIFAAERGSGGAAQRYCAEVPAWLHPK